MEFVAVSQMRLYGRFDFCLTVTSWELESLTVLVQDEHKILQKHNLQNKPLRENTNHNIQFLTHATYGLCIIRCKNKNLDLLCSGVGSVTTLLVTALTAPRRSATTARKWATSLASVPLSSRIWWWPTNTRRPEEHHSSVTDRWTCVRRQLLAMSSFLIIFSCYTSQPDEVCQSVSIFLIQCKNSLEIFSGAQRCADIYWYLVRVSNSKLFPNWLLDSRN